MKQVGVYFESWALPWASDTNNLLAKLPSTLNTVYLAFARPDAVYTKNQNTFNGTGLEFSTSFETIKATIQQLQRRQIKVFIAVGGGAFWSIKTKFNALAISDLANDLNVNGIDIDFEVGIEDTASPIAAIQELRKLSPSKLISLTCFSTGAFPPKPNDKFSGMNIPIINATKNLIDQVNIMGMKSIIT